MTEKEFFTVERDAALDEVYHGTKIADIFSEKIKKEYPGAKITDAGIHYAFGCQLDLTWRNRKFEKRVCKTDPIMPAVQIEELNIWDMANGKSGDFEEVLEDTCYSEDCTNCHGVGHLECPGCHGDGKEECPECHGHEPHTCANCNGTGNVRWTCSKCDGKGRTRCSHCYGEGSKECKSCGGVGELERWRGSTRIGTVICSNCHGTGRVTCPSCNGAGSFVCVSCGGRGGETETCGKCHGTGELQHCGKCQDKGIVTCRTCNGEKKLHCEKCGDVGHHTWIYHLIQREQTKTMRSVSVAHAYVGECRSRYKTMDAKSDCDRMEFAVTGGGSLHFGSNEVPESLRTRVAKMWQAMFWGKEFKEYDDDLLKDEQLKSNSSDKESEWKCRVIEGKLLVTKIDTHAYVNIRWKNKKSTLFFEPCKKRFILGKGLIAEKKKDDQSRLRRKRLVAMLCEICAIGSIAYFVGVQYDYLKQPIVKKYLSLFIEHYITMQVLIGEKFPSVYGFWNWPAVMSLLSIAVGVPLVASCKITSVIAPIGGMLSAIILMIALPFMDGISWYLAVVVDFVALLLFGSLSEKLKSTNGFVASVADLIVMFAIAYVVCHFFL